MNVDSVFWRSLRADFETLRSYQFSLMWFSTPPLDRQLKPVESQWAWLDSPDDSMKTRLNAIALRGATALGCNSEDAWYDELRRSEFVHFRFSGSSQARRFDGVMVEWEHGPIHDIVKESITLCYKLEADCLSAEGLTAGTDRDHSNPWRQAHVAFLHGAYKNPDLYAHWDSRQELWGLREIRAGEHPALAAPEGERLFKDSARDALRSLRFSQDPDLRTLSGTLREPSQVWLGLLRREKRGFQRTRLPRTWVEFRTLAEAEGPVDLAGIPLSEDGGIMHVFQESADFLGDMESHLFQQASPTTAEPPKRSVNDLPDEPSGTLFRANEWSEVEILFFNERTVQITVAQASPSVRDFGDLGLAHRRGGKPTRAWQALHLLAQSGGVIKELKEKPSDWRFLEKRMQELRVWLRRLFGLSTDPIPFIRGTGYRAKFKIGRAPSYQK